MIKKDLLSYEELREKAENIIKDSPKKYKEVFEYFDIGPIMNYNYLYSLNKIKDKNDEFSRLMYTLNLEDRKKFNSDRSLFSKI